MKHQILLGFFAITFLFSCKKDNGSNPGGGTGNNKKLLKQEFSAGQNSGSFTYVYGADGRLARLHMEGSNGSNTTRQGFSITRNAAGMIQKLVYLDDGSRGDSLTIVVTSSGDRYTKAVESATRFGSTTTFTAEFIYDNSGRITETKNAVATDGVLTDQFITEYTYQNNNVTTVKFYQVINGAKSLYSQEDFMYDNKTNPLPSGSEWILYSLTFTSFEGWNSANNITRHTSKSQGMADEVINTSYTYNISNLPVKATSNSPGQPAVTLTYTYEQ